MASNFNSTTPAAPAGGVNVIWQTDGAGNDSAYVPASAGLLASVDLTAQDANIAATAFPALTTLSASGRYRISIYAIITTADLVSSTLPSVVISWTDADNATAQSATFTASAPTGNTLTTLVNGNIVISAESGTSVTYATTGYASGTALAMKYAIHLVPEAI